MMRWYILRRFVFALVVFFVAGCGRKTKEIEVELGHRGPARQDPFLAANRFLEKLGYTTHKTARLRDCLKSDGALITTLQSFANFGETDAVMSWAKDGGHFIIILAGGENWRNDWDSFDLKDLWKLFRKDEVPEQTRMLKELGVGNVSSGATDELTAKIKNRRLNSELRGNLDLEDKTDRMDVKVGDDKTIALVSHPLGYGRVTILAHAHPWRNRYIGNVDNAELLAAVVQLTETEDVWFLNGVRISFWTMLWDRAWFAIVALVLLLIVWLARHLRRLGPPALLKGDSARDFSDHLLLTGAFLWRHREGDSLVRPVQQAVFAAARRSGWSEITDEFFADVAARTGFSIERVRSLLTSPAPRDPQAFRQMMIDLKKVLDCFGA
jgi:hypothetical protein